MPTGSSTRRRVLFVEDEAELRSAYAKYFRDRHDVAFAGSGAEARAELSRFHPDVVVLDLRLPDGDGIDLLRELRAAGSSVPVVVTTAYASMQPMIEILGLQHSGFLFKPFDLGALEARIDAAG